MFRFVCVVIFDLNSYTSYGGFGESSSFGGESSSGGGKDDWFDDFLAPAAAPSSSFSSGGPSFLGGGPSFLGGATDEPEDTSEPKKKEPTKKYLHSTYPVVDANLMLHVVLQVLIEVCPLINFTYFLYPPTHFL